MRLKCHQPLANRPAASVTQGKMGANGKIVLARGWIVLRRDCLAAVLLCVNVYCLIPEAEFPCFLLLQKYILYAPDMIQHEVAVRINRLKHKFSFQITIGVSVLIATAGN